MADFDFSSGDWFVHALDNALASERRDRHPFALPRLHYSADLAPDGCARKTFYALRYDEEPQAVELALRAKLGNLVEAVALEAIERAGNLVAKQVRVKPLRPSAWCWEGTADAVVREPDGALAVYEVKSVEADIARCLAETGRLDLVNRERHAYQLAAYKYALEERLGPLRHYLLFLPIGDGPVVKLAPPLPSESEIVAREENVARLMPLRTQLGESLDVKVPERLPLVHKPRKKVKWEASPQCRWCSHAQRCGVAEVVAKANEQQQQQQAVDVEGEVFSGLKCEKASESKPGHWCARERGHAPPCNSAGSVAAFYGHIVPPGEGSWTFDEPAPQVGKDVVRKESDEEPEPVRSVEEAVLSGETLIGEEASRVRAEINRRLEALVKKESDEDLVNKLCEIESGLTEFEVDFCESVARRVLDEKRGLSDMQRKTVEKILDEKG